MKLLKSYLEEIENRRNSELSPKPIENSDLIKELIQQIGDLNGEHRELSLELLIYNVLPGTTDAAFEKALFLQDIILKNCTVEEISIEFAFELLSHMRGGPSINVLLNIALGEDKKIAEKAASVLKSQVFLYDSDILRLELAFSQKNPIAVDILKSYAEAEFFTKLPSIEEEIKVVTYIAAEGDISTDLLSPGNQAHSRADRELHGKCMINEAAQKEIEKLKKMHPEKSVMLVAEKGTMGVGSSRMSGVNNVALWTGRPASPYIPFVNIAPIVAGTNGISPIFLTTVGVTGGIGIDLKNWAKKLDEDGNPIFNNDESPILEQKYSVETGTALTINTKKKNNPPKNMPNGISLNKDAMVTNNNPGPAFGSIPNANNAGKITNPAKIAIAVSKNTTIPTLPGISLFFLSR